MVEKWVPEEVEEEEERPVGTRAGALDVPLTRLRNSSAEYEY